MQNKQDGGCSNDKKKLPYTSPKITMQELQGEQSSFIPQSNPNNNRSVLSSPMEVHKKEQICNRNQK